MTVDSGAAAHGHAGHDPDLAHHFENRDQQYQSAKLGMWVFLATEILFFGGLFCAYAVYRANHPEIFVYAHQFLNKNLGGLNTLILIGSSFTMAWAVRAAQLREMARLKLLLVVTLVLACGFLGIKYVEYKEKWEHGLLWAGQYRPQVHAPHGEAGDEIAAPADEPPASDGRQGAQGTAVVGEASTIPPAATGPPGLAGEVGSEPDHWTAEAPANARTFFSIYFMMTGLHGLHVIGGMLAMLWLLRRTVRGDFAGGNFTAVELVGLYWHLVDLIWIYLFPLLYLIR